MIQTPNIKTPHGNGRILIVEDVEAVRSLAQRIVSDLGYQVQVAHGGFEALKLLDEGNVFDVLFTDIMMPEMDGEALAKIVKQRFPKMKILFVSGFSLISYETINGLDAKYITKPYRKIELAKFLQDIFNEDE
jgi:CheY-like chemotaxis protein